MASLVPHTAEHYIFQLGKSNSQIAMSMITSQETIFTETRDLVSSSSTPAFSRYFLNSSFFASWVILDIVAAEVVDRSESKANLGKNLEV